MEIAAALRLLQLAPGADAEGLRDAFRRAVKAAHPDRPGGDGERLRQVIEAYRRLGAAPAKPAPSAPPAAEPDDVAARIEITTLEAVVGGWSRVRLGGGRELSVRLPAGLRAGEPVRILGRSFKVAIVGARGARVTGDDLLMTVQAPRALIESGGRLTIETPAGEAAVWISKADGARGFARLRGLGLPARGARPAGDLILSLKAAPDTRFDTPLQAKRRQFAAAWAA